MTEPTSNFSQVSGCSASFPPCPTSITGSPTLFGELGPGDGSVESAGGEVIDTDQEAAEVDVVTRIELDEWNPLPHNALQLLLHQEILLLRIDDRVAGLLPGLEISSAIDSSGTLYRLSRESSPLFHE